MTICGLCGRSEPGCPPGTKLIPLTQGFSAIIDEIDYERVSRHTWCVWRSKRASNLISFYAMSGSALNPNGKFAPLFLHSVILNANYIDHRNGNGLDNRRANLRAATDLGNVQNMRKRSDVSSIYKGVSWRPDRGKWQVHIRTGGHSKYLGIEVDELEAALLYIWASRKYHGEFGNAKPYTPPIIPICKEKLK